MNILLANPYLFGTIELDSTIKNHTNLEIFELVTPDNFNFDISHINHSENEEWLFFGNASYNNHSRLKVFSEIMMKGIRPIAFVHEKAMVANDLKIGFGSVIYPNALVDKMNTIGYNSMISPNAVIHRGCKVGNNCFIGANVILEDGVSIGNNSYICDNTKIIKNVVIEKNVVINDPQIIKEKVPEGFIMDTNLGDYVRIMG